MSIARRIREPLGITKAKFERVFELLEKQKWLKAEDRYGAFWDLLESCRDEHEKTLLQDLLSRYTFLEGSGLTECLQTMLKQIVEVWQLPEERTQLAASEFSPATDSSRQLMQMLKPHLKTFGWKKCELRDRLGDCPKKLVSHPNVVVIDEFVGTGKTMVSRLKDLRRRCRDSLTSRTDSVDYSVRVCVLATMEEGLERITSAGFEVFGANVLKKGISSHLTGTAFRSAVKRMFRLESRLAEEVDGERLRNFGWGHSEALYGMDQGNVPNNVFPIFWWHETRDGQPRRTLLRRWKP